MNRLKILISFLILLSVLSCSRINRTIEEKVLEQQKETIHKIDSVMQKTYSDSLTKDLDRQLKALDSLKNSSDSSMKELEKSMKKFNNPGQKKNVK